MLKKIDESLYPLTLSFIKGDYVPPFEMVTVNVTFNDPDHLVSEFLKNKYEVGDIQRKIESIIEVNDTYVEWKSHFKPPLHLHHIEKYMYLYSSTKYYEKYGKDDLIAELYNNVLPLPKDQVLFRGGSNLEIPSDWKECEEFVWDAPRSTTLNVGVAYNHAFADCTKVIGFRPELDRNLTPIILVITVADEHVKGYVFNYEEDSDNKHEKEVLLSPNITLVKSKEIEFDSIKVIYAKAFGDESY